MEVLGQNALDVRKPDLQEENCWFCKKSPRKSALFGMTGSRMIEIECTNCGKRKNTNANQKVPVERYNRCKFCEKATKINGNQTGHMMTHKDKEENCIKCEKRNNIRTNPKVHDGSYN